jgi:hypothetical protein
MTHEMIELDVPVKQIEDKAFYQATKLYKIASEKTATVTRSNDPNNFMLLEDTKLYILKAWLADFSTNHRLEQIQDAESLYVLNPQSEVIEGSELSVLNTGTILQDKNGASHDVSTDEGIVSYLKSTHKEALPEHITAAFVHKPIGTKSGIYFSTKLAIKYAGYLDKDLERQLHSLAEKAMVFAQLAPATQTQMLGEAIAAISDKETQRLVLSKDVAENLMASVMPSLKQLEGFRVITNTLKDELKLVDLDDKYGIMFNSIYRVLFGHDAAQMRALIELPEGKSPREFMSLDAYLLITQLEAAITIVLSKWRRNKITPTASKLFDYALKTAQKIAEEDDDMAKETEIAFLNRVFVHKKKFVSVTLNTTTNKTTTTSLPFGSLLENKD